MDMSYSYQTNTQMAVMPQEKDCPLHIKGEPQFLSDIRSGKINQAELMQLTPEEMVQLSGAWMTLSPDIQKQVVQVAPQVAMIASSLAGGVVDTGQVQTPGMYNKGSNYWRNMVAEQRKSPDRNQGFAANIATMPTRREDESWTAYLGNQPTSVGFASGRSASASYSF